MTLDKTIILKNGTELHIRNGVESDGQSVFDNFNQAHAETDFLLTYPDENSFDPRQEGDFLKTKAKSVNEVELVAFVNGKVAGTAGIESVGSKDKVKHRAEFGISILKEFWGLGIGRALMSSCIECAKKAGYRQLELTVVADNTRAVSLYKSFGFVEFGRNPMGFNSRTSGFQEVIYMRLDLETVAP